MELATLVGAAGVRTIHMARSGRGSAISLGSELSAGPSLYRWAVARVCGIAGLLITGSAHPFLAAAEYMAAAMSHRGPDSEGVVCLGECLLVNARLAILDLSERGRQPMSNAEGTVWITYNGEAYNAAELREQLIDRGHQFRSTTDTEVVLHLYEEYGERCVERLRGMFAFAVWDTRSHKLLLARDRLGIKPLYVARSGERLVFGSELKTLFASGLVERRLDHAGLRLYLQIGHVPPPWTIIDGVEPLEPGHVGTWQDGVWTTRSYWSLKPCESLSISPTNNTLATELGDVLLDAMRKHLVADVPIVLFLSGGVDSACLGALARSAGAQNLSAMTVGFAEAEFDETSLTRRTAQALDLPLQVVTLAPARVVAELDHAIWAMDQPTVDGLNSYWISKLAAEAGYKVAISGQGGDEFFGGYTSLAWFERFAGIAKWTRLLPAGPFSLLFDRQGLPFRWRKLSYLFGGRDGFLASQLAVKVLFPDSDLQRFLVPPLGESGRPLEAEQHLRAWAFEVEQCELRERLSFMDIHTHLEPRLLRDMDAMSMAHSIEVRPVLVDHRLAEFLMSIPASFRLRQKRLLLEAAERFLPGGLRADLESRGKRTFTFPFARWLDRDMREVLDQAFSRERLAAVGIFDFDAVRVLWHRYCKAPAAVGWSRIWSLFVLQRWCERMGIRP
jgi:asparagine synthase (glutamine-hydrolysing)